VLGGFYTPDKENKNVVAEGAPEEVSIVTISYYPIVRHETSVLGVHIGLFGTITSPGKVNVNWSFWYNGV